MWRRYHAGATPGAAVGVGAVLLVGLAGAQEPDQQAEGWQESAPAEEPPGDTESIESTDADGPIDEVIVTADRRRKSLQDYAGTAQAFSQDKLLNLGVNSVQDLGQMVPGLQIGVNDGGAQIYLRGIGSDNTTELGDPAVGVHLDGVYLPRFRGLSAAWLDIERVEVASGPQGTVRGRNAVGGTINIVSKKPVLGEYQANAEVVFGTFRQRSYQAMVNLPFGDHVALRLAGRSRSVDGTWENAGPIDHLPAPQEQDEYALKGQLRLQPLRDLDIIVAGDYTMQRGTGYVGANVIGLLNNTNENGTFLDGSDDYADPLDPADLDNPRRSYLRGRYPDADTENWGVRLTATYDAGPVQFELLGSHRFLDWRQFSGSNAGYFFDNQDLAFQQWDAWSFGSQQNNDSRSTVGEFRIFSPDDQDVVWSLGIFGFQEDQAAYLGQITGDPDGGFNEFNMPSTRSHSIAGYGDVTWAVTDNFRVMGGLRYSVEHKDRLGGLWIIGGNLPQNGLSLCARQNAQGECVEFGLASQDIGRFGTEGFRFALGDRTNYNVPTSQSTREERVNFFLDGIESFGARDQTAIALCNDPPELLNSNGDRINVQRLQQENGNWRCVEGVRDSVPEDFLLARPQNGEQDDQYLDFRLGMELDLAKDNMVYATLSSGHKAGGFNDSIPDPTSANQDDPDEGFLTPGYGPETAYALEIGSKNFFLGRGLRVNAAAFGYLYDALQFQTIITVGQPPPLNADGSVATDPATGLPFQDNRGGSAARQNVASAAKAYGLDLDITYAMPLGLEVELHGLLMDSRFPNGTYVNDGRLGLGAANAQVDIGDKWLTRVSPYTLNFALSQVIYATLGRFDWQLQGQWRGRYYLTPFNGDGTGFVQRGPEWGVDPVTDEYTPIEVDTNQQYSVLSNNPQRLDDKVDAYVVVNLAAGWQHPDGRFQIRGFVNNLFNTAYESFIFSNSGVNLRWYNDPRMAGVRMRMEW